MKPVARSQQPVATYKSGTHLLQATSYTLQAAFTLIELLVVCAIMVVVTAIILANNNAFGGQVLLQNFAYDLALSIRQAQVYGISVERFGSTNCLMANSTCFSAGYGMHFNLQTPEDYILFADAESPANGLYDGTPELVQSTSINRGYFISKLCAPAGTDVNCDSTPSVPGASVQQLDIVFIRPEPDAWISANGASCILSNSLCEPSARIVLESPRGDTMSVSVFANGQISVDQTANIVP